MWKKCKKAGSCPYPHSEAAHSSSITCPESVDGNCIDASCPYRHSRGKKKGDLDAEVISGSGLELIKCGGMCGQSSCAAHFASKEKLSQHINISSLLQCRHCHAIFLTCVEYQEHEISCRAHMNSGSIDLSSDSVDIKELADSESDSNSIDSNSSGGGQRSAQLREAVNPIHGSASANIYISNKKQFPHQDADSGGLLYPGIDGDGMAYDNSVIDDSECDDDGEGMDVLPSDMTRLLSLNDQGMCESGVKKTKATKIGSKKPTAAVVGGDGGDGGDGGGILIFPHRMEPVGIFWDIENCPVPVGKAAFSLATKMRRVFFEGKREAEFMCVCDVTKEKEEVTDALHNAQVTVVHVSAIAKNAADDKLRKRLRQFAHTYPAPSTVVLISSDVNFSSELSDLRHVHNLTIVLVHNPHASQALKVFAHELINFCEFCKDVEPSHLPQPSTQPKIMVVSNLPKYMSGAKVSHRLNRLSVNCGGKVRSVDRKTGTAKILFKKPDFAYKALKRMSGQDVYGYKIITDLETQPPPQVQQKHGPSHPKHSSSLSNSFPSHLRSPHAHHTPHPRFVSPQPQRPHLMPPLHRHPANAIQAPLHTAPYSKLHGPEGKILVCYITELELDQLNKQMAAICLEACIKAEHQILWHNLLELQVLMRVDFMQTASAMKEDVISTLIEKKQLKEEVAQTFLERCAESIKQVSELHQLPWKVTLCKWTEDEEEERIMRSNVVSLLHRWSPYYWTKWNTFKQKFSDLYSSAISEMAIHNACRGAVQIFGDSQNQVIIFYQLSPLLKVVDNQQVLAQMQMNFIKLLHSQVDKKIKLLNFVCVYKDSQLGDLPMSSSGKPLQEVITNTPGVTMVGVKPSNIYVTLVTSDKGAVGPVASTPQNLAEISAAFVNLLVHTTSKEIPLSQFQHKYQTFYRKSFRVSDYLSGTARLRDLLEKCSGIKLEDIPIPSGGVHTVVGLDDKKPPTASQPANSAVNSSSRRSPEPAVPDDISTEFRSLLAQFPDRRLPLSQFQQEYQTYFHHSFRVSDYLSKRAGLRDLLNACQGIKVVDVMLANGKRQAFVHRLEDISPPSSPSTIKKPASVNVASPSVTLGSTTQYTGRKSRVSPIPDAIPTNTLQLFRQDCKDVLSAQPNHRVHLARFSEAYYKAKGQTFVLARYKAKKIVLLAQAIPDTVKILGEKDNKIIELITDPKNDFEDCVQKMLYCLPNQSIALDCFVGEYEKHSGKKLSTFYGHSELLKLLEGIPDTVRLEGTGSARLVQLQPRCTFAMDMAQLVSFHPEGLFISQLVPIYKITLGRELVVANLGYPKLITALESLSNILVISGEGANQMILPKLGLPEAMLPPLQQVADEIFAILKNTFSQKLSLIELTARYNTSYHPDHPRVAKEQLLDALKKLPYIKIVKCGTATFVQLIPSRCKHLQGAQGGGFSKPLEDNRNIFSFNKLIIIIMMVYTIISVYYYS